MLADVVMDGSGGRYTNFVVVLSNLLENDHRSIRDLNIIKNKRKDSNV
jgi:hypothetical protein